MVAVLVLTHLYWHVFLVLYMFFDCFPLHTVQQPRLLFGTHRNRG